MINFLIFITASLLLSALLTVGLGIIYFSLAIGIINLFNLNYCHKPWGYKIFNFCVFITIISYFILLSIIISGF